MTRPSSNDAMTVTGLNTGTGSGVLGSALVASNGQVIQTMRTTNNFQQGTEVKITFTRAANGTTGKVVILKGAGETRSFAALNQTGTTFVCPGWSNNADAFMDYMSRVGLLVNGVRFDTNNTDNYNHDLVFGDRMPNGSTRFKTLPLNAYRVGTGGGSYATTATMDDDNQKFAIYDALFIEMSDLEAGSSFTIYLNIVGMVKDADTLPVAY